MNGLRSTFVRTLTALLLVSASAAIAEDPAAAPARAKVPAAEGSPTKPSPLDPPSDSAFNQEPLLTTGQPAQPEADPLADLGAPPIEDESLIWTLVRTFLILGFVIACIYVVLNFGLRRMMGLKATGAGGQNALVTVVERIPLGPKQTLLVLKAAGEYLLVGSADSGMNLIAKLETEEVERLQRERAVATGSMSPFLQKLLSRGGHPPPSA